MAWRYENYGTADLLSVSGTTITTTADKSKFLSAFYQTAQKKCFDIPATKEIWIKFDVYFDGTNRWRAYNQNSYGFNGITAQTDGRLSFFANDTKVKDANSICKTKTLQTFILHMASDSSAGIIEAWAGGAKIYTYTGNVNKGADFADIYLQSNGAGTFFSNVIISDEELTSADNCIKIFIVESNFDTLREIRIVNSETADFDTERIIRVVDTETLNFDTSRKISNTETLDFDTSRNVILAEELSFDTFRRIKNLESLSFDTSRKTPHTITDNSSDLQSYSISLAAQQLSDTASFVTTSRKEIMEQVKGKVLDYQFAFRIESITQNGILYSCECCSDLDELLYTPISYKAENLQVVKVINHDNRTFYIGRGQPIAISKQERDKISQEKIYAATASSHLECIAKALGISVVHQYDDFFSTMENEQQFVTYGDLITQLFGWTNRIETRMINAYLRNGVLYVIQRGQESNVIDISKTKHTLPSITRQIVRKTWSGDTSQTTETRNVRRRKPKKEDFVQTTRFEDDNTRTETTYYYDEGNLLQKTDTTTTDKNTNNYTHITTNYIYKTTKDKIYLAEEREETWEQGSGSFDKSVRTTYHVPLNNGQMETAVYEDGQFVSRSVGQGSNQQSLSEYTARIESNNYEDDTISNTIQGNLLIDPTFPVYNEVLMLELTNDLKAMNRKTQETVNLEIYDYQHLIDFNDRIILNGNTYFLQSNRAEKSVVNRISNKQTVQLVRWY